MMKGLKGQKFDTMVGVKGRTSNYICDTKEVRYNTGTSRVRQMDYVRVYVGETEAWIIT